MTTNRRRKQSGYLYKASGVWYVRHHDDRIEKSATGEMALIRKQVSTRIGTVKDFTKEMARVEAVRLLQPINSNSQRRESVQSLSQFVDEQFLPFTTTQVRPSTLRGFNARWRQLKPWCGELRLRDTTTRDIQEVLTSIHNQKTLKRDSIRSLRFLLKVIFDHAIRLGLLNGVVNPVLASKVPKSPNEQRVDTPAYTLDEIVKMLAVLLEPARTAVATCAFTGVRRGELAGMTWENFDAQHGVMQITQSVWEGHIGSPKTRKSKAPIPIIGPLIRVLEAHRARTAEGKTLPIQGPIFVSKAGTPLNMNNLLNRQILPVLNRCETCRKPKGSCEGSLHRYQRDSSLPAWAGWHGFRRGLGTNLQALDVDLKTTMEILRHAQISTTADFYVKEVSEQSKTAMMRLEKLVESLDLDHAISATVQ
jgi:integrase